MTPPSVSVVLPAYNAADTIEDAVTSILDQTLGDLELVVVDDGSTDGTGDMLSRITDARLVVVRHPTNLGLTAALHHGIDTGRAATIARMDADDIAHPDRLAMELELLRNRPAVGLVATAFTSVDEHGSEEDHGVPPDHASAWFRLLFTNCLAHPTAMFHRTVYDATGGYRASYYPAEDHDLWLRMAELTEIATIATPLLRYRRSASAMSMRINQEMTRASIAASQDALLRVAHRRPSVEILCMLRDMHAPRSSRDARRAAVLLATAYAAVWRRCRARRIPTDRMSGQLKAMLARLRR